MAHKMLTQRSHSMKGDFDREGRGEEGGGGGGGGSRNKGEASTRVLFVTSIQYTTV